MATGGSTGTAGCTPPAIKNFRAIRSSSQWRRNVALQALGKFASHMCSPGCPQYERDPARARLRADAPHSQAAVCLVDVAFDRRRNTRQHQLALMADAPHQRRRHLDSGAGSTLASTSGHLPGTASGLPRSSCNRSSSALSRAFSKETRNASSSMSMASARGTPNVSAASASTPTLSRRRARHPESRSALLRRAPRDTAPLSGAARCRTPRRRSI